jgi:single-stranded DNA-binding protein
MATITFDGNVGKTAELRTVKVNGADTKVCSFWVGENISKRDGSKKTIWHKVTLWRGYAEKMAQYLTTGRHVLVEGYAEAKTYTTKDNRIVPYMDVQPGIGGKVKLLDRKNDDELPPETEEATEPTVSEEEAPWD